MTASAARKFDPYRVLGVDKAADPQDVKRAFRRRAKETHPDHGGSREDFDKVNRAHLVLIDPERRQRFDETGEADDKPVDNLDAAAMNLINGIIQAILSDDRDPFGTDLVKAMTDVLQHQVAEMTDKLGPVQRAKKRAEKMIDRFKRRNKGENRMRTMLEWHLLHINKEIASIDNQMRQRRRAIAILADYQFDFDRPVPTQPGGGMWFFGAPGSSASAGSF